MEPEITTKHLQGISDLTLVAPIKQDFISALETRTYATRLRAILKTLHTLRQTSREQSLVRPFSDATDRIRTLTDLRMAILDERTLLLSVTFDRPWEPYLRVIWRDVGTLLDVIFCNCDGYPISCDSTFAEYGEWVRQARTNVEFFYRASALTFDDAQYLKLTEQALRETAASDLELAKLVVSDPEAIAKKTARDFLPHTASQGLQALAVLYRLVDQYPVGTPDGAILLRASQQLLRELSMISAGLPGPVRARFAAQLAWFEQQPPPPQARVTPVLGDTSAVQGGILNPYGGITHGCVLLLSVRDPAAAAGFLAVLRPMVSIEGATKPAGEIYVNVAFTPEGLRALGLSDAELAAFPHEYCEGMQERAGLIGDVRGNHPQNWALPERNWPAQIVDPATGNAALVQLQTVHLVVQMYIESTDAGHTLITPLKQKIDELMNGQDHVQLLCVQPMRRYVDAASGEKSREHFGFVDGISQPKVRETGTPPGTGQAWSNVVGPGEILLGYANDRGDVPTQSALRDNGSFLVIRKLRQDVKALNRAINASGIAPNVLKARMMGRTVDGDPLAVPRSGNAFDYRDDEKGSLCPFAAHVRRANPRTDISKFDGRPTVPRIMRRGMSYGPRFEAEPDAERGVMFMCYNASIAEQFEVIQRWVSGGNSSGVMSEQSDPLLGVPQLGETRLFRYHDVTDVTRVKLDAAADNPSRPFVRLEWGVYLFAPSTTALDKLKEIAQASARPRGVDPSVVDQGKNLIAKLSTAEDWKAMLEDSHARSSGESEAVWAYIREQHNGVLRTPYGVVVASPARVMEVLQNAQRYSVSGYMPRLRNSIGEIYLGLDDGGANSDYSKQSTQTNAAIMKISEKTAFELAFSHANSKLSQLVAGTKALAAALGEKTWELTFDIKELSDHTLARLCEDWIGPLDSNKRFQPGGWRWDWKAGDPPLYPGHFTAPSRYLFQPEPGTGAQQYGTEHGKAVLEAMKGFVDDQRSTPATPLAGPIFDDANLDGGDLRARTLVGVMMGFLPTVDGNLRATLFEWLGGGTLRLTLNERLDKWSFWDLQNAFVSDGGSNNYEKALEHLRTPLMRTMQLRPVPELLWRTAVTQHTLGDVKVENGDKIVIASVSAAQDDLAADRVHPADKLPHVYPVFGGDRNGPQSPTHACPGYQIGIGVLLGMISALMEMGPVRPTPAPLTLTLRGTVP